MTLYETFMKNSGVVLNTHYFLIWAALSSFKIIQFWNHLAMKQPSHKTNAILLTPIWAVTCDFQQCGILTSVDSGKYVQPPFKLRNSKCCSAGSWTFIEYSSDLQRLWSDCAYAQNGLNFCWSHIPHCWKSHVMAQLCKELLAIRRIFSLVDMITNTKFSNCPNVFKIVVVQQ